MYAAIEEARSRSLLELLVNRPVSGQQQSEDLRDGQRRVANLQRRLLATTDPRLRRQLLDQIFAAEERMASAATRLFARTRLPGGTRATTLRDLQQALRADELFLEFALLEGRSYVLVVTSTTTRVQGLPGRTELRALTENVLRVTRNDGRGDSEAAALGAALLGPVVELRRRARLVISPDGELHGVPFELLSTGNQRLLDSHVVSYAPSGAVLTLLRQAGGRGDVADRRVLSVSASPGGGNQVAATKAVKQQMIAVHGPQATPRLWSGLLAYGDGRGVVKSLDYIPSRQE
jgi:hypothetical protein